MIKDKDIDHVELGMQITRNIDNLDGADHVDNEAAQQRHGSGWVPLWMLKNDLYSCAFILFLTVL